MFGYRQGVWVGFNANEYTDHCEILTGSMLTQRSQHLGITSFVVWLDVY